MGDATLNVQLGKEIAERLEHEAYRIGVSRSEVARYAIEDYLNLQAHKQEVMAAAVAEANKGLFISSEAMMEWMDRLERDPDAPAPEPDIVLPARA